MKQQITGVQLEIRESYDNDGIDYWVNVSRGHIQDNTFISRHYHIFTWQKGKNRMKFYNRALHLQSLLLQRSLNEKA